MKARFAIGVAFVGVAAAFAACVEPPPKIDAIPTGGLSLRVFVFGASAQEARRGFDAAKQNNKTLSIVHEGGDGEVLIGLENDSPKCVPPTALCTFKFAVRVRDNQGKVVHASTQEASANSDRCADLCARALNAAVVKAIEAAASSLKAGPSDEAGPPDASDLDPDAALAVDGAPDAADAAPKPAPKKPAPKPSKPEPPAPSKPEPSICSIAHGPPLPAEEAEKRAAQVEVLKRLSVLDQDEYDCLRKAYLDRL